MGKDKKEDVFDRFTDPFKKRKRRQKSQLRQEKRKEDLYFAGKKFAKDVFNEPLTTDKAKMLTPFICEIKSTEYLKKRLEEVGTGELNYKIKKTRGINSIMDFIACSTRCKEWLEAELNKVGWKHNKTHYNPIAVSHSSSEVMNATVECFKMSCKQMLLYIDFTKKENFHDK
jgi:hypothetical protein